MAELAKFRKEENGPYGRPDMGQPFLGPVRAPAQVQQVRPAGFPAVTVDPTWRGIMGGTREEVAARAMPSVNDAPEPVPTKGLRQLAGEAKNFWLYGQTPGTEIDAPAAAPAPMRGTAQAASPSAAAGVADFTAGMSPAARQAYWDKWSNNPDKSWENGGAATPGTVLSFRGGGREGSFVVPEGRSTPATWADLNSATAGVQQSSTRGSTVPAPAAAAPAESGFTSKFSEEGLRLRSAAREAAGADASPEAFRAKVMELAGSDPTGNRVVNGVRMNSDQANNIAEALYRGPMTADGTAATFDDSFRTVSVDRSPTEAYKRNVYLEGPSRVEAKKRVRGDITVQQVDDTRVAAGPQETQVYNPRQFGGQGFRTQAEALSGVPVETALKSAQAANFEAEAATLPAFRGAQVNKYNAEAASEGTRADAAMIAARAAETSAGAKATTDKWVQTEQTTGYDTFGAPVTSKVLINPTTGAKIDPTEYAPLAKRAYQALDTKRRQLVDDYLGDRDADPMDILAYIQSLGR